MPSNLKGSVKRAFSSLDECLRFITTPLEYQNPVASVERLIMFKGEHFFTKLKNGFFNHFNTPLTKNEHREIMSLIKENRLFRNKNKVEEKLRKMISNALTAPCAGSVNTLFVIKDKQHSFGFVEKTDAQFFDDGRGEHKYYPAEMSKDSFIAIQLALDAVTGFLQHQGLRQRGLNRLRSFSFVISIGKPTAQLDGTSMGMGVAVSILSALCRKPIDNELAFTGEIRNSGIVNPVYGIKEKLRAAYLKSIKKVFVPQHALKTVNDKLMKLSQEVSHINSVFEALFSERDIRELINRLNGEGTVMPRKRSKVIREDPGSVFISMVGKRDPFGTPFDDPERISDGPIVTAVKKIKPATVLLISTPQTEENSKDTRAILQGMNIDVYTETIKITDPTDYDLIYDSLQYVFGIWKEHLKGRNVYVSLSSGTAQMHTVLFYMLKEGHLKATPVQVREERFVKSWHQRVNAVSSKRLLLNI